MRLIPARATITAALLAAVLAAAPVLAPASAAPAQATSLAAALPASDAVRACPAPAPGHAACALITAAAGAPATARAHIRHWTRAATASSAPAGLDPLNLQATYKLPAVNGGVGQEVAFIAAGADPTAAADLAAYRSQWNLPPCTTSGGCLTIENQNGGTTLPTNVVNGWPANDALGLDTISAVCPNCKLLLVEANSTAISDLAVAANTAATTSGVHFVDNAYAGPEISTETTYDPDYNHTGVAMVAAAGDTGYSGTINYPAASPYVISAGGTVLTQASGPWTDTSAWPGTVSGCSLYESAKPSWQTDTGCAGRTDNDVAAAAATSTSGIVNPLFLAYYNTSNGGTGWTEGGGTTASASIITGIYALAGTPTDSNPAAYPYAHTSLISDITTGSTGTCSIAYLCTAGTGYDGPTGLGTPASAAALGPAAPSTLPGKPMLYDSATGNLEVYATGTSATEFQDAQSPAGKWSGWTNLSGLIDGAPAALYNPGSGNLEMYAKATNGTVEEKYYVPGDGWHGWDSLSANTKYPPAATYDPLTGAVDVFETGTTGTPFEKSWTPGNGWTAWQNLGGTLGSSPDAVYDPANGSMDVFATGTNGVPFVNSWTPAHGWSGWVNLGGTLDGDLAAAYNPLNGTMQVFGTGTTGTPFVNSSTSSGGWTGWVNLGGTLGVTPAPAYNPLSGAMDIYAIGTTGTPFVDSWTPAHGWSGWVNLGGTLSGGLAPAYSPAGHSMDVFGIGTSGTAFVNSWTPAHGWSGWQNLGGVFSAP